MKRDARIGLAIILVLGLSITFLVARSMHNRAQMADADLYADGSGMGMEKGGLDEPPTQDPLAMAGSHEQPPVADASEARLRAFREDHRAIQRAQPGTQVQNRETEHAGLRAELVDLPDEPTTRAPRNPSAASRDLPPLIGPPPGAASDATAATLNTPTGWSYVVEEGDSPWRISEKVLGNGKYAAKIIEANPEVKARSLRTGQKLVIPVLPGLSPRITLQPVGARSVAGDTGSRPSVASTLAGNLDRASSDPTLASAKTYTVKPNDTLTAIAREHYGYGGPKSIQRIMDANPGLDAQRLRVGNNIKLPASE